MKRHYEETQKYIRDGYSSIHWYDDEFGFCDGYIGEKEKGQLLYTIRLSVLSVTAYASINLLFKEYCIKKKITQNLLFYPSRFSYLDTDNLKESDKEGKVKELKKQLQGYYNDFLLDQALNKDKGE